MNTELLTKCSVCGQQILFLPDQNTVVCRWCDRLNARPKSTPNMTNLMKYANELRNEGEFAEAQSRYRDVLAENLEEHEARWGLLLCKYGVMYVESAASKERLITCRRAQTSSFRDEPDYKRILEQAPELRTTYEKDAEYIDLIQGKIRRLRNTAEPYDVFLCYKETAPEGGKTEDSDIAYKLYNEFTRCGYRVFFAPESLKNQAGANYEAAIYLAIETAKVMLVIGTKKEYFESTWVRSEWRRFLERIDLGDEKWIIPLFGNADQLPDTFQKRMIQGYGMCQPYLEPIKARLNSILKTKNTGFTLVQIYLKQRNFRRADQKLDEMLNDQPENPEIWLYKSLVSLKMQDPSELVSAEGLSENEEFKTALEYAKGSLREQLEGYLAAEEKAHGIITKVTKEDAPSKTERINSQFAPTKSTKQIIDDNYMFMANVEASMRRIHSGQTLTGRVLQITKDEVGIDIGYKTDGVIKRSDLVDSNVKVGDEIVVEVVNVNDGKGNVILSQRNIINKKAWDSLMVKFHAGEYVEGIGKEAIKGGLICMVDGIRAFVPVTRLSKSSAEIIDQFVGQTMKLKIINMDVAKKRIICSQKDVIIEEETAKTAVTWKKIEVGSIVTGIVRRFVDNGAIVDLGDMEGLIHNIDLAWYRIGHPSEVLQINQTVRVKVLFADPARKVIQLGYKQLHPHPWDNIEEKYPVGLILERKVVRIRPFGAFIELEPGVDGLVYINEIALTPVAKVEDALTVGQKVVVKVLGVDPEAHRISLSIREALEESVFDFEDFENSTPAKLKERKNTADKQAFEKHNHDENVIKHADDNNESLACSKKEENKQEPVPISEPSRQTFGKYTFVIQADGTAEIIEYTGTRDKVSVPGILNDFIVSAIGDYAFDSNDTIEEVELPPSILTIGMGAFRNCKNLRTIEMPDSVNSIGSSAFEDCSFLERIKLPAALKTIESSTFSGTSSLEAIEIPYGVDKIEAFAFYESGISEIVLPDTIAIIEKYAFCDCDYLTEVQLPPKLETIEESMFSGDLALTTVIIPYGIETIGPNAFADSGISEVELPNSIVVIGESAFEGCGNLTIVNFPEKLTELESRVLAYCPKLTDVFVPESVQKIADDVYGDLDEDDISPTMHVFPGSYAEQWCISNEMNYSYVDMNTRQQIKESKLWKQLGLCQHCGGVFNIFKKCKNCGTKKDY